MLVIHWKWESMLNVSPVVHFWLIFSNMDQKNHIQCYLQRVRFHGFDEGGFSHIIKGKSRLTLADHPYLVFFCFF